MPDRIIRDELLSSDPWLGLKRNTHRLAFVAIILNADSLGNLEASEAALWRLWRDPLALQDRASVAEILAALHEAGLVRLYEIDQKRYGHVPKFRQRLRYMKGRHPRPPANIECNEIHELLEKSQTAVGLKSVRSTAKLLEEKRREVKRSEVVLPQVVVTPTVTRATPPAEPEGDKSPAKGNTGKQWWRSEEGIAAKAKELCEQARPGETFVDLKRRLFDVIAGRERQATA